MWWENGKYANLNLWIINTTKSIRYIVVVAAIDRRPNQGRRRLSALDSWDGLQQTLAMDKRWMDGWMESISSSRNS